MRGVAESIAKKKELMKNSPKPQYITRQELRRKINQFEKQKHDARKPSPLSD